jgi:hypothetical protein
MFSASDTSYAKVIKMKNKLAALATAFLAASFSLSASAMPIIGTISFSNGLDSLSSIVSDLTTFDIGAPTNASGGTGDFLGVAGLTAVNDIDILAPGGVIYSVGGFDFTLASVNNVTSNPINCFGGLCNDSKGFQIIGTVAAAGFDSSQFIGRFTANAVCLESDVTAGTCSAGTESGSWSSSVVATASVQVPAPATLLMFGAALVGLGWSRRKKA